MSEAKDDVRNKILSRRRTRVVPTEVDAVAESSTEGKGKATTTTLPEDVPSETTIMLPRSGGRDRTSEAMASVAEGTNFIATLARHLGAGNVLNVYVDPDNDAIVKIEIMKGTGIPIPKRKSLGSDYYFHIHNPGYWAWENKWKALSPEDKIEYATNLGVVWENHENPKINNMRLTEAVRVHENVEKYKPEYATAALRKTAKANYLAGQLDMSDDS